VTKNRNSPLRDLLRRLIPPVEPHPLPPEQALDPVQITARPTRATSEGWVERICRHATGAEVRLVLADGTTTSATVQEEEIDWLELAVDQIVNLRRLPSASDPGVRLFRECVDLGG
jgi:hypothetical protein